MDYNPDTINKLIGAKVASYKSLAKEDIDKKKDLETKEDIHINDTPYDITKAKETKSTKEKRIEDAYSFLLPEVDDIYDDLYDEISGELEESYTENVERAETGKIEDSYNGTSETQEGSSKYIQGAESGLKKMLNNKPRRWKLLPKSINDRRVRSHYDKTRSEVLGNVAAELASQEGRFDPEKVKTAVQAGDRIAAPIVRKGAKLTKEAAKNIVRKLKNK